MKSLQNKFQFLTGLRELIEKKNIFILCFSLTWNLLGGFFFKLPFFQREVLETGWSQRENSGSPSHRRHLNTGCNTVQVATPGILTSKAPYSSQTPSTISLTFSINKRWSPVFIIWCGRVHHLEGNLLIVWSSFLGSTVVDQSWSIGWSHYGGFL